MKIYGEIKVTSDNISLITKKLEDINNDDWEYLEEASQKASLGENNKVMCIKKKADPFFFYLREYDNELLLFQIVPINYHSLSKDEYNTLLEIFRDKVLLPIKESIEFGIEIKTENTIEEVAGEETFKALGKWFDESEGLKSHPSDFRKWVRFLSIAQQNDSSLDAETFRIWLIEEKGFTEEKAEVYSNDYEYGREIIKYLNS